MRLYNALAFLQDAGFGGDCVSVYETHGSGIIIGIDEALEERTPLARKLSYWFDRPVVKEPHVDAAERIVLCVGWPNWQGPEPEWDGFWDFEDLPYVYDDYETDYDAIPFEA